MFRLQLQSLIAGASHQMNFSALSAALSFLNIFSFVNSVSSSSRCSRAHILPSSSSKSALCFGHFKLQTELSLSLQSLQSLQSRCTDLGDSSSKDRGPELRKHRPGFLCDLKSHHTCKNTGTHAFHQLTFFRIAMIAIARLMDSRL